MDISWENTSVALVDFVNVLVCGKCGLKPVSPIRLINCGHFFCHDCIKSASKCIKCDVPVQPIEMKPDHIVSNLIQSCDIIGDIINRRDIWNNTVAAASISADTTVSKIVHTPKKQGSIPKNINKPNPKGETQLHIACLKKNIERVKLLLMAGADPNTKDHANWTPLQEMVSYGYTEICELLLKGGALIDTPGFNSRRPLHEAVICDRIEEAKLLLQHHARKDVYDEYGKKPIDYCQSNEMQKILMGDYISHTLSMSDLNQTLDKSFISGCHKFVIFASDLKPKNQKLLTVAATKHKFKILTAYRSSVTHVIVEESKQNVTKFDILFTIMRGNWLLNSQWITLAIDMEDISEIDLEIFEVNGRYGGPKKARQNVEHQNPRLFNNCFFYFAVQANNTYWIGDVHFTKEDLIKLVKEGEGTVLSREPKPEDLGDVTQVPFHTAGDLSHPLHKCTHYIIYTPGKDEPPMKYNMPHIRTLPLVWLIECIEKFTLVNPEHLGLS